MTELSGLRLKTETFSDGAPLAELVGQGGGPRKVFCGGEGDTNTKAWQCEMMTMMIKL